MKGKERTALYRYYDSEDHLLYVGVSLHAIQRMAQHRQEKPWYEEVTRVDIEYYPSRAEAERAERFAIQQERPQHNIQHAIVDGEPVEHFTYDDLVKKLFYWEQSQKFYAAYDYKKRQEEMTCELHSTFFEVLATSFPEMKKYAGQRKPHAPSRVFVNALSAQYQEYFRDDYGPLIYGTSRAESQRVLTVG